MNESFTPLKIGGLTLRNRIVRSGCFEGLCQEGAVTDRLIEHHRGVAAGGVGMTTVAYCSVSYDGRAFGHEMWMRPEIVPDLARLTEAVHGEGAAASIQIGHCGYFASPRVIGRVPLGASRQLCLFRLSVGEAMTPAQIERVSADFECTGRMARDAGFDAIEVHAGHGYLLSQFLSPYTNHRRDEYGGSLENRLRFPLAVIHRLRAALGADYPILIKMNQRDGFRGGLELDEAVQVAQAFEAAGASALIPSGGFSPKTPFYNTRGRVPVMEMVRGQEEWLTKIGFLLFGRLMVQTYPFERLFQLEGARKIRAAVKIPVGYVGGAVSRRDLDALISEGFAFAQVGRATIRDPNFANRLRAGEIEESDCDHCNRCIATMSINGVVCVTAEEESRQRMRSG